MRALMTISSLRLISIYHRCGGVLYFHHPVQRPSSALAQQLIPIAGILSSVKNKMAAMQTSPQAREPRLMISSFLAKP